MLDQELKSADKKLKQNIVDIETLELDKNCLEEQNKQLKSVLKLQSSEMQIYKLNIDSLENEVKLLRNLLSKEIKSSQKK